jgi:class 3 adenylate cyclase
MAWDHAKANARIGELIRKAPQISVREFIGDYLPGYEARRATLLEKNERVTPPLFDLPRGEAILVDAVHIYISIVDYDRLRMSEDGVETESSHAKALKALHLYYSACDRVIEASSAQRVDFHSSRMHAVILGRNLEGVSSQEIAEAFKLIKQFEDVAHLANQELAEGAFSVRFRVGVDFGRCVAINNGIGLEKEPMFLGSAANHAAKLSEGDEPGVFASDRVRELLGRAENEFERRYGLNDTYVREVARDRAEGAPTDVRALIENWRDELDESGLPAIHVPTFRFSHKEPPLADISFADLSPAQSIRMPVVSLFADLCGFTKYIDDAISSGNIQHAVLALYVIREEFQNVAEKDFGGRKIRFIGDCINAVLAEGNLIQTDDAGSVAQSVRCAAGFRSSFQICQEKIPGVDGLGLAIGLELGDTPISRIGIRGDRSVRVASSSATCASERLQRDCEDNQIKVGSKALALLPAGLRDLLSPSGVASDLTYDEVMMAASDYAPASAPAYLRTVEQPSDSSPPRAHSVIK